MKEERHRLLREIISGSSISTQAQLAAELARRGLRVRQSTLSRDLAELGARKQGDIYVIGRQDVAQQEPDFRAAVIGFLPCGPNLVVLRTRVGAAQPVAVWLDQQREPAIVATLAGDDTIFIATKSEKTQVVVLRRLETWFGEKRER